MDPIDLWLKNRKGVSVGKAAGSGTFAGAASGASVAPVVPNVAAPTPVPTIAVGGSTPDYAALIKADPGYQAYLNNSQKDLATASAQRRAALQKLAIQYGGLPAGLQDQYGDIDAGTLELAQKNEFSDVQRLSRQYAQGVEAFKRALAARGALQSGDLGYGLEQADIGKGQAEYEMGNNFANAAQGIVNDYVGAEGQVRGNEVAALNAAQANVFANPANRPVDAYDAPLVAGSVEQYGQPLYQGQDGKLYTLSGQPFAPPGAGASLAPSAPAPSDPTGGYGTSDMIWTTDPNTGQPVQVPRGYVFPPGQVGYF